MKKMIAIVLAVSGISTCIAESGRGYKVLDEVSNCTPKGACRIQHVNFGNDDDRPIAQTVTIVPDVYGITAQSTEVEGIHHFTIHNTSGTPLIYELYVSLECAAMKFYDKKHIQIENNGWYSDETQTFGTVQTPVDGTWTITGASDITGNIGAASLIVGYLYTSENGDKKNK